MTDVINVESMGNTKISTNRAGITHHQNGVVDIDIPNDLIVFAADQIKNRFGITANDLKPAKRLPKQTEQEIKDGWVSGDVVEEVFNKVMETEAGDRFITELGQVDDVLKALVELGYLVREE